MESCSSRSPNSWQRIQQLQPPEASAGMLGQAVKARIRWQGRCQSPAHFTSWGPGWKPSKLTPRNELRRRAEPAKTQGLKAPMRGRRQQPSRPAAQNEHCGEEWSVKNPNLSSEEGSGQVRCDPRNDVHMGPATGREDSDQGRALPETL